MKKFAGFTPQQQYTLLTKQGYKGPLDKASMDKFLAASPSAASKMGEYTQIAQQRLAGKPMQTQAMAEGGTVETTATTTPDQPATTTEPTLAEQIKADPNAFLKQAQDQIKTDTINLSEAQKKLADLSGGTEEEKSSTQSKYLKKVEEPELSEEQKQAKAEVEGLQKALEESSRKATLAQQFVTPVTKELMESSVTDPMSVVTKAEVAKIPEAPGTILDAATGQVQERPDAAVTTVEDIAKVEEPKETDAAIIDATLISDKAKEELDKLEAAKGQVSAEGTVKGQLEILMEDFEKDGTPPWASGAMRQAMSVMQARGLGASSMAGQAVVQAAMESAISIAERDAATVAQFEMQNLNNEQQTLIFKTQTRVSSMLSDQAAENAAKQFNAASENQTNQFFAELKTTVSKYNAEQINAIRQFNAGEVNAAEKFNTQLKNLRDQFNASNSLVIAQANAQWRQNIATLDTAAQNEANMTAAKVANGMTQVTLDQIWQRERDIMNAALTTSEGDANRSLSLLLADKEADALAKSQKSADTAAKWQLAATVLMG